MGPSPKPFEERFFAKVRQLENGCWQWTAHVAKTGYARIWYEREYIGAHRAAYLYFVGPIPDGFHIDHLCRNPACVNPAHLEPVTPGENVLRGVGITAQNARKTHCKRGHPLSGDNLIFKSGGRACLECRRNAGRLAYYRNGPPTQYNETRVCVICGSDFEAYRHHPTTTCSKKCGTTLGWQKRRQAA